MPALAATLSRRFGGAFGNEGDPLVEAANAIRRIDPGVRSAIAALIDAAKLRHGGPAEHLPGADAKPLQLAKDLIGT